VTNTLNEAASYFRPLCRATPPRLPPKSAFPVEIVDIIRDEASAETELADGLSWTPHSKHLPQPPEEKSEAIDVVPLSVLSEHKPTGTQLTQIGKRLVRLVGGLDFVGA